MASPSKPRLNTKSSDLADFLRTSSRATDSDEQGPTSLAFLSDREPESPARKRSSRIPFLGRQRKKSTQSDASASSVAGPSGRQSETDVRHSSVSRKDSRPDIPTVPPLDDNHERPLPALPIEPPAASSSSSSPSLGSKLAARFAPSRQKLFNISPRKPIRPPAHEPPSEVLPTPRSLSRAASVNSAGTSSDHRSVTPRPSQPTITVSLPPDQLDGYEGMFTLPNSRASISDPQLTPTPSNSPLHFPKSEVDPAVKRRSSRSAASEKSSSRASRTSRKHVGAVFRQGEVDSTDAEDSEAVMSDTPKPSPPMSNGPTPTAEKRRTLPILPYNFSGEKASPRSIMKSAHDHAHRPPAFPPPPTNPPSSALPVIPPSLSRNGSPTLGVAAPRQRAQTLTFVPNSSAASSPSPASPLATPPPSRRITKSIGDASSRTGSSPPSKKAVVDDKSGKENFDMEKASPDQLRQALKLRNQQFDELASYLLKITEAHVAEKQSLLKKVASLEQEAGRLKNEIKGLTWLVTNNARPGSGGSTGAHIENAMTSNAALEIIDPSSDLEVSSPGFEDSGAESHPTSGGDDSSMWGSGTSGGESSPPPPSRIKKAKRNPTLMSNLYQTSFSSKSARKEAPADSGIPTPSMPYRSSPNAKRSSVSSFGTGTSPSSSTSSLSLGTVTPATTVTSLSSLGAIPESAPPPATPPPPLPLPKSQHPVVAAAILATENQRAKEERRASKNANRVSASVTTPASATAAAYAANLKRGRPPSIAQVLSQGPQGRERTRSYASGSASS
ncbi:hypothetical protein R3P38DRAFT_2757814 [Favolaschia claudopus]|uniref:Uncharacterized protein n=1 Tax=Favolaschia claudopus TaxID=2862362 RepID=A0AAW0EAA5_9AGAR